MNNQEDYNSAYAEDDDMSFPAFELPHNRVSVALLIGLVAGLITALIHFLIPFLNVQAFQTAATQGAKMSYNTALTVTGLNCLGIFLIIVICAFTGYFVGKFAVQRRLGFFAGLLVGGIYYLSTIIEGYIPVYPGSSATPSFMLSYILPGLLITLIFGCLGGLISLLATWMTTRHHPYYTGDLN
ncbi:MAG: YrzE family protein [Ktedonobacteraceae bacterium]|nr:YrzE family protein [Ktedonobacteraceae bacterium]